MPKNVYRSTGAAIAAAAFAFLCVATSDCQEKTGTDTSPGTAVYAEHCAMCHDKTVVRVPTRAVLQQRTSGYILKVLNTGVMKQQGADLSAAQRMAVANWLGRKTAAVMDAAQVSNACKSGAGAAGDQTHAWTSWGGGITNERFQTAAAAALTAEPVGRLKLKWALGVPDVTAMRAQPVVYDGSVIFGGGTMLYAVDAATGCTRWSTELPAPLRSGLSLGAPGGKRLAFFGDGGANVHAVDASTGAPVWQTHMDKHPAAVVSGTPVYHEGKLYVSVSSIEEVTATVSGYVCCTFRGSVAALDAATGKILWQTYTIDQAASVSRTNKLGSPSVGPSGAAVWSAPTLDVAKNVMYVGTGDNYSDPATDRSDAVLALALDTGKIVWSRQFYANDAFNVSCLQQGPKNCPDAGGPDFDFGASPILLPRPGGKRILLLAQKSGAVYGIDPDQEGKPLWKTQLGKGGPLGGVEWGPATDGKQLYVAISDESFTADGLDPAKGGGLYALSPETGKQLWMAEPSPCDGRKPCSPAQTAAVTAIPGVVFSGSLNGHVRAYAAASGQVLWDFDTGRDFETVNKVPAHGGSISVAGPVVAGGSLYILSGYDTFGEAKGNVLLAFSVDGK
jgi:polyvinyl alcohol dehydrogenase (cytochrome)